MFINFYKLEKTKFDKQTFEKNTTERTEMVI